MLFENFFGHLRTVRQHRHQVLIHCIKAGIPWRGLVHDLSKFSPTEFIPGVKYYQGNRSPNEREREVSGYSLAWMHHKGRNKHHYEYWIDVDPEQDYSFQGVKMPLNYVLEMVCDRIAASKVYNGDRYTDATPWEYYQARSEASRIHPETRALLEKLLTMLKDEGEFRTLGYMRWLMKHPDRY